ncbi:transmembrane protein 165-like isoform X2 [Uloborus diversus]|nr:transmembrane protein 165-like isoform X2 [Uloborus diversus]
MHPEGGFAAGALSAFTVTAVSELGDKTFFIAVVLACSHPALIVLAGALSALVLMTILSAALGLVSAFIPEMYVQYLSAFLFFIFGIKMLKEGYSMGATAAKEELEGVEKTIAAKKTDETKNTNVDVESGKEKKPSRMWVLMEAFIMTFLAEWGDRSQITTVILAAKYSIFGVILGAVLGHTACTSLAVLGGRLIADRISLRIVTVFGGVLFLAFGAWSLVIAIQETL